MPPPAAAPSMPPVADERRDQPDQAHAEVGVAQLVDDLLGALVVEAEDALRGAGRVDQLAHTGDRQPGADAPERPPRPVDHERVTTVDREVL